MDWRDSIHLLRQLPYVALATGGVVVLPSLVVWELGSSGAVASFVPLTLIAIALSLLLSRVGRLLWERWDRSGDVLFGDLMLWGWLRRVWTERRLGSSVALLGLSGDARRRQLDSLSSEDKAEWLEQLAIALEARDPYTHGHSRRVTRHAAMIAKGMGLAPKDVARIRTAAALHDVGKIDTPSAILNKPGALSDEEFAIIQQHPVRGAEMVAELNDAELTSIVRHHHERLDGTGYPDGLPGDRIPLGARIIAVADTFDAMTSERPYRRAKAHKEALDTLRREAGTQLDPDAVQAFCSYYSGFGPLMVWATLTSLPQRLLYPIFVDLNAAGGAMSTAKVMTAVAATAAVGTAALETPDVHRDAPLPARAVTAAAAGDGPGPGWEGQRGVLPRDAGSAPLPGSQRGPAGDGTNLAPGRPPRDTDPAGEVGDGTHPFAVDDTTAGGGGHSYPPEAGTGESGAGEADGGEAQDGGGDAGGGESDGGEGSGEGGSGGSESGGEQGESTENDGEGESEDGGGNSGSGSDGSESGEGAGSGGDRDPEEDDEGPGGDGEPGREDEDVDEPEEDEDSDEPEEEDEDSSGSGNGGGEEDSNGHGNGGDDDEDSNGHGNGGGDEDSSDHGNHGGGGRDKEDRGEDDPAG